VDIFRCLPSEISLAPVTLNILAEAVTNGYQLISPPMRLTMNSSPTYASSLLPTPSSGYIPPPSPLATRERILTPSQALAEGYACEIAARRNAMDNASKNAGEMIGKFQILYNRTRQAVITGELVEIITGAAASAE
jgi:hypothetical protein